MYTRGRKKVEAEPAPPTRDSRDVEPIERLQQQIQELELQQLQPDSPAEEAETEPNVWDDEPVDVNPFGGRKHSKTSNLLDLYGGWEGRDVCKLALKAEKHIKAKSKGFTSRFTPPTRTAPPTAPKIAPKATTPTTLAAGNTRERVDNAPHCYKYGGFGHYARDCLNLKTIAFVPNDAGPIYDTDAEP
ncbi:hypothetical protein Tco_0409085 [Tanacetum coccineum]